MPCRSPARCWPAACNVVEITLAHAGRARRRARDRRRGRRHHRRRRHRHQAARRHPRRRCRRGFSGQPRHAGRPRAGAGRRAGAGAARLRHRVGGDDARRVRLSGAEVLSGRGVGRRALAQRGGRAAARHPVLPDRRRERRQRRVLSRACAMCWRSAAPGSRRRRPSPLAISPASPRAPASRRRCAAERRVLRSAHPTPAAQSLRLVVGDHRGRRRGFGRRRLLARRPGAVPGNLRSATSSCSSTSCPRCWRPA